MFNWSPLGADGQRADRSVASSVTAALTVGRSDDLEHAKRFIREKTAPDRAALTDEATDLSAL